MNAKSLFATAAIAVAASGAAFAEADPSQQYALQIDGNRTRAEVQAEAAKVSATRSNELPGGRAHAPMKSDLQVQAVRAEAVQALRLRQIPSGEASL